MILIKIKEMIKIRCHSCVVFRRFGFLSRFRRKVIVLGKDKHDKTLFLWMCKKCAVKYYLLIKSMESYLKPLEMAKSLFDIFKNSRDIVKNSIVMGFLKGLKELETKANEIEER